MSTPLPDFTTEEQAAAVCKALRLAGVPAEYRHAAGWTRWRVTWTNPEPEPAPSPCDRSCSACGGSGSVFRCEDVSTSDATLCVVPAPCEPCGGTGREATP